MREAWKNASRATVVIIALNILYFLVTEISGPTEFSDVLIRWGALYTPAVKENGQYWRLFSAMFLHAGIRNLLNNMLTLYVLGSILEGETGWLRYSLIYLLGGLSGNAVEYGLSVRSGETVVAVGASGAVFAVMGALVWVLIRRKGRAKGMTIQRMLLLVGFSVYFGFASSGVANAAHVGGLLAGFLLGVIFYRLPKGKTGI